MDIKHLIDTGENNVQVVVSVRDLKRFVLELINDPQFTEKCLKSRFVNLSDISVTLGTSKGKAKSLLKKHGIYPVEKIGATPMYDYNDVKKLIYV